MDLFWLGLVLPPPTSHLPHPKLTFRTRCMLRIHPPQLSSTPIRPPPHSQHITMDDDDDKMSVSSFDFIPSPHNKIASLHGPPSWHHDYRNPTDHWRTPLNPQAKEFKGSQHRDASRAYVNEQISCSSQFQLHNESSRGLEFGNTTLVHSSAAANLEYGTNAFKSDHSRRYHDNYPGIYHGPYNFLPPTAPTRDVSQSHFFEPLATTTNRGQQQLPVRPEVPANLRTQEIISILLNPPVKFYTSNNIITLELPWVKQVVGDHLVFDPTPGLNRQVLKSTSEIRTRSLELGLPIEYYSWLCGKDGWGKINELKIPVARLTIARNRTLQGPGLF